MTKLNYSIADEPVEKNSLLNSSEIFNAIALYFL